MADGDLIPCRYVFCNGSEFEYFIETQCEKCTRFRKGRCKTYNACWNAMNDEKYFPFSDLLDIEGYAGKRCKHFTDKPIERKRRNHIVKGQLEMEMM
jgi:hypothetical protein